MKNYFTFITRNWWLKLLALILALVVFYGVRGSIRGPRPGYDTPGFFTTKDTPHAAVSVR